jgi:hypothetical protein
VGVAVLRLDGVGLAGRGGAVVGSAVGGASTSCRVTESPFKSQVAFHTTLALSGTSSEPSTVYSIRSALRRGPLTWRARERPLSTCWAPAEHLVLAGTCASLSKLRSPLAWISSSSDLFLVGAGFDAWPPVLSTWLAAVVAVAVGDAAADGEGGAPVQAVIRKAAASTTSAPNVTTRAMTLSLTEAYRSVVPGTPDS